MSVLLLPLFSLYFLRVYQNQLIQETESELIAQSAALAAVFRREVETAIPRDVALGAKLRQPNRNSQPIRTSRSGPSLNWPTRRSCRRGPRRSTPSAPADPAFLALGARMAPDLAATQNVTLAGFRLLDPNGIVIAGREEVGLSLAHLEEVAEALQGRFAAVLRVRNSKHDQPAIYSISRGTGMRVFTAMPVIVRDQVAGVVYASRTPSNVFKYLYEQRTRFMLAVLATIIPTLLIGFLFHRTITEPMRELVERTNLIGKGDRTALRPLKRHGTSEFARLSESFLEMARRLDMRSHFISTFATHVSHELKSPLTSIQGAAELLRDDVDEPDMDDDDRRKFLDNIMADTERLAKISGRLRDLARAENPVGVGIDQTRRHGRGDCARRSLRSRFAPAANSTRRFACPKKTLPSSSPISPTMPCAMAAPCWIFPPRGKGTMLVVKVSDNGEGISPNNRAQIFDSFFTTRREQWRNRHGACHRARNAGSPWRRDPSCQL